MVYQNMKVSALLYAAGLGTRMGSLTKETPKPLIKVAGRTLLDHALDIVDHPGISDIAINTHYLAEKIQSHAYKTAVKFSYEPKLLETGGGLKRAAALFSSETVLTMNTDAVWAGPNPLPRVLEAWNEKMDALLLLVPKGSAHGHKGTGDFDIDQNGKLSRGSSYIYTGVQLIKSKPFVDKPEDAFSTNDIWDQMLKAKTAYGVVYSGQWCDVGYPEAIPLAEAMLEGAAITDA